MIQRDNQVRKAMRVARAHAVLIKNNLFTDAKGAFVDLYTKYSETMLREKNYDE